MSDDQSPYEKLLVDLARAEVRFVTIGGVACALCGFVRTTDDVDILVDGSPANIRVLLDTLAQFGEGHARELQVGDFTDEEGAIRVIEDFPLDIFVRLRGHTYADLVSRRAWHDAGGVKIPYLSAVGLLLLKEQSAREKDQIDVSALRRLTGNHTAE
jgi:hypothetical protein